jgi:hypothetical protein
VTTLPRPASTCELLVSLHTSVISSLFLQCSRSIHILYVCPHPALANSLDVSFSSIPICQLRNAIFSQCYSRLMAAPLKSNTCVWLLSNAVTAAWQPDAMQVLHYSHHFSISFPELISFSKFSQHVTKFCKHPRNATRDMTFSKRLFLKTQSLLGLTLFHWARRYRRLKIMQCLLIFTVKHSIKSLANQTN